MKIFLTGATGFIGQRLVRKLSESNHEIYLLIRKASKEKAKGIFKDLPKITYIEGDVLNTDVLADIYSVSHHIDQIDCVVHLAALYELNVELTPAYLMNVVGTQNIINLLKKMKSVTHFHYFSTYAVNPIEHGQISEDFLSQETARFSDKYSKTKNDAEQLVRKLVPAHISSVIHRPGIIIGDSSSGKMDKIDGPYYFFKFIREFKKASAIIEKLRFLPLPVLNSSTLPVLPVDILVDWSATIINTPPNRALSCYHLLSQEKILTKDFLERSLKLSGLTLKVIPVGMGRLFTPLFPLLNMPKEIISYMTKETVYNRDNLERDYPTLRAPAFSTYLPQIIDGFMKEEK